VALRAVDPAACELPARAPDGYFDSFATRVRQRIEKEPAVRRRAAWRPPVWSWAVAAALLLAVVTPITLDRKEEALPGRAVPAAPAAPAPAAKLAAPLASPAAATASPEQRADSAPPRRTRAEEPKVLVPPRQPLMKTAPVVPVPQSAPTLAYRDQREEETNRAVTQAGASGAVAAQTPAAPAPQPAPAVAAPREQKMKAAAVEAPGPLRVADEVRAGPAGAGAAGRGVGYTDEDAAFQQLERLRPTDVASWRELRERWRAFAAVHPAAAQADEARVRVIAAGLELWRLGAGAVDEARFRRDAESYLARQGAPQKPRVRAMLDEAGAPR